VADVHLGYSWAQRRKGELGPLADFQTREKLLKLCEDLQPKQIVFLGDLVHAPRPCRPEREWIESTLLEVARSASLIAVRGNHDRAFAREFGSLPIEQSEFWSCENIVAVHGDRLHSAPDVQDGILVLGHWHPCLGIRDAAGASHKMPVFLASESCLLLPAFSPFARGCDIREGLPVELLSCFRNQPIELFVASKSRVTSLGPLAQALKKMWSSDTAAPAQFRWPRRIHQ
jgi:uncharacterized protein